MPLPAVRESSGAGACPKPGTHTAAVGTFPERGDPPAASGEPRAGEAAALTWASGSGGTRSRKMAPTGPAAGPSATSVSPPIKGLW